MRLIKLITAKRKLFGTNCAVHWFFDILKSFFRCITQKRAAYNIRIRIAVIFNGVLLYTLIFGKIIIVYVFSNANQLIVKNKA